MDHIPTQNAIKEHLDWFKSTLYWSMHNSINIKNSSDFNFFLSEVVKTISEQMLNKHNPKYGLSANIHLDITNLVTRLQEINGNTNHNLSLQNGLSVIYNTLVAGHVKAIELSYSFLIQFVLANVTRDTVLKEIIGILFFDV